MRKALRSLNGRRLRFTARVTKRIRKYYRRKWGSVALFCWRMFGWMERQLLTMCGQRLAPGLRRYLLAI